MRPPRNPFKLRASEHIDSDEEFLSLFAPGVLDVLPADAIWDRVQPFRSTPGGGKTSLFRVFTPGVLTALRNRGEHSHEYRDLYGRMSKLGALSTAGVHVLGVLLSCAQDYTSLEGLEADRSACEHLFYSLLNARIIICTLYSAATLVGLTCPDDLNDLVLDIPQASGFPRKLASGCCSALYDWACGVEEQICAALHSFSPSIESLHGHISVFAPMLLQPGCIKYRGEPVATKAVLMLDDVQRLTAMQKHLLLDSLTASRLRVGIWVAERLEGVCPTDAMGLGTTVGRERNPPITLESYWMGRNSHQFSDLVNGIADRRLRLTSKVRLDKFLDCLEGSLSDSEWQATAERTRTRVLSNRALVTKYPQMVGRASQAPGSPREQAISWRSVEILAARHEEHEQKSLDFGLPVDDAGDNANSGVRAAAEFFLCQESKLPYYYGFGRLAALASWNIEQFLGFSADLFERVLSANATKQRTKLDPKQQQAILKRAADQRWEDITSKMPDGREVQHFLQALCDFAAKETNKPNAPYPPGVTGIGISTDDLTRLASKSSRSSVSDYGRLWQTLYSCIAFNLLEAYPGRSQGKKGRTLTVLYLNRWLCLRAELPVGYGGWRSRNLDEMCGWLQRT